jgi:hypothetical protein
MELPEEWMALGQKYSFPEYREKPPDLMGITEFPLKAEIICFCNSKFRIAFAYSGPVFYL